MIGFLNRMVLIVERLNRRVVFSDKALGLLAVFHAQPLKPVHVREAVRRSGFSHERVCHYLKKLETEGLLVSEVRGRNKDYKANFDSELTCKAFAILDLKKRGEFSEANKNLMEHADRLKRLLVERVRDPVQTALLFNWPKAGAGHVDLLLLTNQELSTFAYSEIGRICKDCSTTYNFRIFVDSLPQFRTKWSADSAYRKQWMDGVRLYGEENFWHEFFKLEKR